MTPIPDKGRILTAMSLWWFERLAGIVDNHVISADVPQQVAGRAVVCERLQMLPVECVVRGYLSGSGWVDYQADGAVCGVKLPTACRSRSGFPSRSSPCDKAAIGDHDQNIDFGAVVDLVGEDVAERLRHLSVQIYTFAHEVAASRGLILADTKFEFGVRGDGRIVLADEVLTPIPHVSGIHPPGLPGRPAQFRQTIRPGLAATGIGVGPSSSRRRPASRRRGAADPRQVCASVRNTHGAEVRGEQR